VVPDAHSAVPATPAVDHDAHRDPVVVPRAVRRFLESHRFGVVASVNPDGSPHQAVVWYLVEPDGAGASAGAGANDGAGASDSFRIVVNSREGRRWPSNLRRDPRIRFAVYDGHDWVGLSGRVTIQDDQPTAQHDIATMARLNDPPEEAAEGIAVFETQQRVSFRFRPTAFHAEIEAGEHIDEGS
jgi:hypothetical protein